MVVVALYFFALGAVLNLVDCEVPCVHVPADKRTDVLKETGALYYCKTSAKPKDENYCYVTFVHENADAEIAKRVGYNVQTKTPTHLEFEMLRKEGSHVYYPYSHVNGESIATSSDSKCFLFWKCPEGADAFMLFMCEEPELCTSDFHNKLIEDGFQLMAKNGIKDLKMEHFDQNECKELGLVPN